MDALQLAKSGTLAAGLGIPAGLPDEMRVCSEHGRYMARHLIRKIWTDCPLCSARKKAARIHEERLQQQRDAERQWQLVFRQANIPHRFADRHLDHFIAHSPEQQLVKCFAEQFAAQFSDPEMGRSAIFSGGFGTGKTHLAVGVALQIMQDYAKTALYQTVRQMVRRVRDTWHPDAVETETAAMLALLKPDLLIIDELGLAEASHLERAILFDVLHERYAQRRSVLLLTHLHQEACRDYLGERTFDRLREDGGQFVAFIGSSYRGNVAA
ncbi:ATP-binding protein [Parachitinimonas caeni]|uniref:ATP-binding protein n=1 Tax=Parachitinimonas caeni TaxID=3031301 RepID=A0ABT7DRA5_9NEIS|nr:ATP-binding protein [Parachitinimonas caeni]MDK2122599.1 ATP-binding protein [Parachitinimonas caeni]